METDGREVRTQDPPDQASEAAFGGGPQEAEGGVGHYVDRKVDQRMRQRPLTSKTTFKIAVLHRSEESGRNPPAEVDAASAERAKGHISSLCPI